MAKICDHVGSYDPGCRMCVLYATDPVYKAYYDSLPPLPPASRAPSSKPKMALGMSQKRH